MASQNTREAILGVAPLIRRLPSWTESFYELTANLPVPEIYKKWAAISTLAGAMERRIWTHFPNWQLDIYPNLYVILVGPPGVGKSLATNRTEDFWQSVPDLHIAPRSVSKASLMDAIHDAKRRVVLPRGELVEYSSLLVVSNEFSSFLPTYDNEFMGALTDIYDGRPYEERKRTKELKFRIDYPQLNIIAATTPSYLTSLMPEGGWEQGFTSRTLLIFSGGQPKSNPFGSDQGSSPFTENPIFKDLVNDLKIIANLYGKMDWQPDAVEKYVKWYLSGGEPVPTHPRLTHYLTRRHTHLAKLCMVASVARSSELVVRLEDYQEALGWLVEAEFYMPDLFKSMVIGADARAIEETFHYIMAHYSKTKKPLPEHLIIQQLMTKVPSHSVMRVLENMVRSNMLVEEGRDRQNRPMYKPVSQMLHQGG